jgi:hypothetical protein
MGVEMSIDDRTSAKKPYAAPEVRVHGDLRRLTAGATGLQRDGGAGATKSKASGAA